MIAIGWMALRTPVYTSVDTRSCVRDDFLIWLPLQIAKFQSEKIDIGDFEPSISKPAAL